MQSDNVSLDKFEMRQLNCKVQFDPFNCGVFSLKVAKDLESLLYSVCSNDFFNNRLQSNSYCLEVLMNLI